jgi:light-harvesting complex 1 beta chain
MADESRGSQPEVATSRSLGIHAIFVVSFVTIFLIALVAQLTAQKWRPWFPGAEGEKSLIGGVKAAVDSFIPYVA